MGVINGGMLKWWWSLDGDMGDTYLKVYRTLDEMQIKDILG